MRADTAPTIVADACTSSAAPYIHGADDLFSQVAEPLHRVEQELAKLARRASANQERVLGLRKLVLAFAQRGHGARVFSAYQSSVQRELWGAEDSWAGLIGGWLEGKAPLTCYPKGMVLPPRFVTTSQVLELALGIDVSEHNRRAEMLVSACMRRLGWDKSTQRRVPGQSQIRLRPWEKVVTRL